MKNAAKKDFRIAVCLLTAFLLWTTAVQWVDTQPIGPLGSSVGFAAVNRFVHDLIGVHLSLYTVTDLMSAVPILFVIGFALLGLLQWCRRGSLFKVDRDLLVLGGFYLVVMAVYAFFEVFVINCRPVLIDGCLEASYPSSTTMLVLCVMPTAKMQLDARIKNKPLKRWGSAAIAAFTVFMVFGRLVSGVHWFTDIIGGALLSAGLVLMYRAVIRLKC